MTDRDGEDRGSREPPQSSVGLPETWPSVEEVAFSETTLYYRLGDSAPLRDTSGRYRRDERGRVALEAFAALPLDAMYGRLAAHLESATETTIADPDQVGLRAAFAELIRFVEVFGPLGLGWSRTYRAENPEADRLRLENEDLRERLLLLSDRFREVTPRPLRGAEPTAWHVLFPELGVAPPVGEVRQVPTFPALDWAARVRLHDGAIAHDGLGLLDGGPLSRTRATIDAALGLADALAGDNPHAIPDAMKRFPTFVTAYWVGSEPVDRTALNWRRAVRGIVPDDGIWRPFKEHRSQVDWHTLGWTVLAQHLSRQLTWGALRVGLVGDRHLQLGWRVGSLLEVMHLQLMEHLTRHPDFGIGICDFCGAPILRVRRGQRWHSGCAPAGRQRESRAARKARRINEPDR